tara:strand:- start:129 stop:815 length:687 start_codon:yes stop_codon:yes gene_type:complete
MKRKSVITKKLMPHDWWDTPIEEKVLSHSRSQTASKGRKNGLAYEEEVRVSTLQHAVRNGYYLANPNEPSKINPKQLIYQTYHGQICATDATLFSCKPNVPPVFTAEMKLTINENIKGPMLDEVICFAKHEVPVLIFTPDKDNQLRTGESKYIRMMEGFKEDYNVHMMVFIDNRPDTIINYDVKRKGDEHNYGSHVRPMHEALAYITNLMNEHEERYKHIEHPFYDFN